MKHGKKYQDSTKLVDTTVLYDTTEAIENCLKTAKAKFDETVEIHVRLALTPVTLSSRFVARLFCQTAPAKPFASWYSARATRWTLLWLLVQTMPALTSTCRRSREAGWISTLSSQALT